MSKRTIVVVALVVLFALSVTALAVLPGSSAGVATGEEALTMRKLDDSGEYFYPPECPILDGGGCGG